MKTAGRENPNHGVALPRNRAHGAEEQNRSRSIKWAEKQGKFQPEEMCFLLTSTFIELTSTRGLPNAAQVVQGYTNCGLEGARQESDGHAALRSDLRSQKS